ncbi:MAG: MFS transporter [Cyclobacteriaceae bacterium]|nr:MFS transporter [Cyclobacteriaceae bacterium]MCH8516845.1 MFS transporter [Cyclobacteriaceae bacterium]
MYPISNQVRTPSIIIGIIISQFFCTSLWFAANAVVGDISIDRNWGAEALGFLSSAVQIGFIIGTLVYAFAMFADRYSPVTVFLISAILASLSNALMLLPDYNLAQALIFRLMTGFFLAGIYPVGMKIAADHFNKGLGRALGFLVGALVLGTAFPFLLQAFFTEIDWRYVMISTSSLGTLGGFIMFFFVKDGPHRKINTAPLSLTGAVGSFKSPAFRKAAIGYWGHMWELYAFWTFLPLLLLSYATKEDLNWNISLLSFFIICLGSISCIITGLYSYRHGEVRPAKISLMISTLCCLCIPVVFLYFTPLTFLIFLGVWSFFVIADSPMFSGLVASHAVSDKKASALTLVNSIGYMVTVVSILSINELIKSGIQIHHALFFLGFGGLMGLWKFWSIKKEAV